MKQRLDCDVMIAGAGPAGASAAILLCRAGLRVILADWQSFPRDKVCGDFVSPSAISELKTLGVTRLAEFKQSHIVRTAALHLDGRHLLTSSIPDLPGLRASSRVIPRAILDALLVHRACKAGAHIREGCRIVDFTAQDECVEVVVETPVGVNTLHSRVLIGADGSGSTIARHVRGSKTTDTDRIIAVRGYFAGIQGPSD